MPPCWSTRLTAPSRETPPPTFTGTAPGGATVQITVDGRPIGTTTADADGAFSFTPDTPLAPGDYEAVATATVNRIESEPSNINDFTVQTTAPAKPVITTPTDGSTTTDPTPVIRGTGEPGATVTVSIDGTELRPVKVGPDGTFTVTVTDPLTPGDHTVRATQTDPAGNTTPADQVGFTVAAPSSNGDDGTAPKPPTITSPADGTSTTNPTVAVVGTAEPNSRVTIIIDGRPVGSANADQQGNFTFRLDSGLSLGRHEIQAVATDRAGNRSAASAPVSLTIIGAENVATGSLAETGGPSAAIGLLATVLLAGGVTLLAVQRRRLRTA